MQAAPGNVMESFKVRTSCDSLELDCLLALPQGRPHAVLLILHGMCETKEKYLPFMRYLTAGGIACAVYDQRGHGASVRDSSELGYMYGGGWEAMVNDAMDVWESIRGRIPDCTSHALLGYSMGSMVAAAFAMKHSAMLDSLVLCGFPGYNPWCVAGRILATATGELFGWKYRSRMLHDIFFGRHHGGADRPGGFIFTADGFRTLASLMRQTHSSSGWETVNQELGIMFASGSEDRYARSDRALAASVSVISDAGFPDTKTVIYHGMKHDILGTQDSEKVWKDILDFLK